MHGKKKKGGGAQGGLCAPFGETTFYRDPGAHGAESGKRWVVSVRFGPVDGSCSRPSSSPKGGCALLDRRGRDLQQGGSDAPPDPSDAQVSADPLAGVPRELRVSESTHLSECSSQERVESKDERSEPDRSPLLSYRRLNRLDGGRAHHASGVTGPTPQVGAVVNLASSWGDAEEKRRRAVTSWVDGSAGGAMTSSGSRPKTWCLVILNIPITPPLKKPLLRDNLEGVARKNLVAD
ncbi:hypothetical protein MUK42_29815 [Musa troglodytarum]|uniref:Uncharacterized protein n=1 Tax=Musa troglodytarum TaxID=320322 RepID=A0A9E7JB14_9LILI|nr:hypothetical protein MUK42_29815 [Musa troglodytarum]